MYMQLVSKKNICYLHINNMLGGWRIVNVNSNSWGLRYWPTFGGAGTENVAKRISTYVTKPVLLGLHKSYDKDLNHSWGLSLKVSASLQCFIWSIVENNNDN